ncbi:MAG: GNAT family N-acetyltransferase [Armatimonadetes bacterium]|nr:GNAT family N-acetyltransferase [Armatimonadota bacterium]
MTTDWIDRIYETSLAIGLSAGVAMEALDPSSAPANKRIGTGRATFCGEGSPLTQVSLLFHRQDFDPDQLDEVDEFFRGRATNWEFNVTPFTNPRLIPAIVERGWTEVQFENLMARSLYDLSDIATNDVETRVVTGDGRDAWADIGTRGFFGDNVPPSCQNLPSIIAGSPGTTCFLAYVDGKPAATATLSQHEATVYLGGAATLKEFRGRGAQTALLAARLRYAQANGCDLALCECTPGAQSQRNQERAGFRVVYTKMVYSKPGLMPPMGD